MAATFSVGVMYSHSDRVRPRARAAGIYCNKISSVRYCLFTKKYRNSSCPVLRVSDNDHYFSSVRFENFIILNALAGLEPRDVWYVQKCTVHLILLIHSEKDMPRHFAINKILLRVGDRDTITDFFPVLPRKFGVHKSWALMDKSAHMIHKLSRLKENINSYKNFICVFLPLIKFLMPFKECYFDKFISFKSNTD